MHAEDKSEWFFECECVTYFETQLSRNHGDASTKTMRSHGLGWVGLEKMT
jgi:hypothetical protein